MPNFFNLLLFFLLFYVCWPAASAASEGTVEEILNEEWHPKLVPLQFYDDPTPAAAEDTATPPKIRTSAKPTTPKETSWKSIVGVLLAVVIIAVVIAVIVWCCRCLQSVVMLFQDLANIFRYVLILLKDKKDAENKRRR
ncbi:hypothetical protein niasHT_013409 [Heterodera trifolii]|uniref:Transmembrane protein n=1 Tax=Heterodera trifolii TaxID=157864 RepID=A0ABD2LDF3_9BILA